MLSQLPNLTSTRLPKDIAAIVMLRDVRHFIVPYEKFTPPQCAVIEDSAILVCDATTERYGIAVASWILVVYALHVAKADEIVARLTRVIGPTAIAIRIPGKDDLSSR